MTTETFNMLAGYSMFGVSFALTVRWLVLSYVDFTVRETNISVQMSADEFDKFIKKMEEDDDNFISRR